MIIEICCGSADDVIEAKKGGADRVELNSNLFHGGLTPTVGSLKVAKAATDMKILTMVRPREGGFCYTEVEFSTMLEDAKQLLRFGADGIVFGFLTDDGRVDTERCQKMMEIIGDKEAVFRRAFDVVPDWRTAMDELVELNLTRILTSGQNPSVYFGRYTVRAMVEYAAGRIEILPGAGIKRENVREIVKTPDVIRSICLPTNLVSITPGCSTPQYISAECFTLLKITIPWSTAMAFFQFVK